MLALKAQWWEARRRRRRILRFFWEFSWEYPPFKNNPVKNFRIPPLQKRKIGFGGGVLTVKQADLDVFEKQLFSILRKSGGHLWGSGDGGSVPRSLPIGCLNNKCENYVWPKTWQNAFYVLVRFWASHGVLNTVFGIRSAKNLKILSSHLKTVLDVLRPSKYLFWKVRIIVNMPKCFFTPFNFSSVIRRFKCCFWKIRITENMKMRFITFWDVSRCASGF